MLIPTVVYFAVWMLAPTVYGVVLSFTESSLAGRVDFVGVENYVGLAADKQFLGSLWTTAAYTLQVVGPCLILAVIMGRLLTARTRLNSVFMTVFFIPFVLPGVAIGIVFVLLFQQYGLVNQIAGGDHAWLSDARTALIVVSAATIWSMVGYYTIIFAAGYQQIPPEITEAATIDGAGAVRRFFSIELPLLRPTLIFALVTSVAAVLTDFGMPFIMTQGGPADATLTLPLLIYNQSFMYGAVGKSSAMAVVLLIAAVALTIVIVRATRERVRRERVTR
ncbi:carbohydrate ABC transporter permease [Herbiconiux sp. A18JL235]|uniref:Carbohydrate ABC transporter permease n=1 Tax=Herbiconiux sp. A18JL235 TaxID=3152363 RepID=A0AB39BHX8_9MICO